MDNSDLSNSNDEGRSIYSHHLISHKNPYNCEGQLYRIVSLWDMLQFNAKNLLAAMSLLGSEATRYSLLAQLHTKGLGTAQPQTLETKAQVLKSVERIKDVSEQYEMKISFQLANECFETGLNLLACQRHLSPNEMLKLSRSFEVLLKAFLAEADTRKFFALEGGTSDYHQSADGLFGAEVVDSFPEAQYDIEEAGRCISFGLSTAAVMHSMRVLEIGLKSLASHFNVDFGSNWNQTLNEIENKIRSIRRKEHGNEHERQAAEAGTHLRFIKNAYRNHAMHALMKYDQRESKEIFEATKAFMRHQANLKKSNIFAD